MSEDKKPKVMTIKGFLAKMNSKAGNSAIGFLAAHREWLLTGELASVTSPILSQMDSGELMPTPCLDAVARAVMNHMFAGEKAKAEASIVKQEEKALSDASEEESEGKAKKVYNWMAVIYDSRGNVCTKVNSDGETEDLIKGFDLAQDSDRWACRRLVECESETYAEVTHRVAQCTTIIERSEAMAIIFAKKKGPVVRQPPKGGGSLSFRPKVRETRVTFSHG